MKKYAAGADGNSRTHDIGDHESQLEYITPSISLSSVTSVDGSGNYARTGANDGTLNAFLIFAMTLFAVVVLHEFICVPSCRHGLIKMEGTPVDTDQPRRGRLTQKRGFVNALVL
jgi:hypothetical protein